MALGRRNCRLSFCRPTFYDVAAFLSAVVSKLETVEIQTGRRVGRRFPRELGLGVDGRKRLRPIRLVERVFFRSAVQRSGALGACELSSGRGIYISFWTGPFRISLFFPVFISRAGCRVRTGVPRSAFLGFVLHIICWLLQY